MKRRHGQRWTQAPTPTARGGDPVAVRGQVTPVGVEPPAARVVPVKQVDLWMRSFPTDKVTHLVISDEVRYNPALTVGQSLTVSNRTVPRNYAWVFTDIEFYATAPVTNMLAPPQNLSREALIGILRLTVTFGGAGPVRTEAARMSPYTSPNQAATTTSGWPWLERQFGAQRALSFALYSRSGEEIRLEAFVESRPRFPIDRIGVNLHGFTVPEALFGQAWSI